MKINLGKVVAWGLLALVIIGFLGFLATRVLAPLALSGAELVFGHVTLSDLVFYSLAGMAAAGAGGGISLLICRTIRNITNATTRKSTTALRKMP